MTYLPINPDRWNCPTCGGKRKLFRNRQKFHLLRCADCDLREILDFLDVERHRRNQRHLENLDHTLAELFFKKMDEKYYVDNGILVMKGSTRT